MLPNIDPKSAGAFAATPSATPSPLEPAPDTARRSRKLRRRSEPTEPGDGDAAGIQRASSPSASVTDPSLLPSRRSLFIPAAARASPLSRPRAPVPTPARMRPAKVAAAPSSSSVAAAAEPFLFLRRTRRPPVRCGHPAGGPVSLAPAAVAQRLLDVVVVVVAKLRLSEWQRGHGATPSGRGSLGLALVGASAGIRARLFSRPYPSRRFSHLCRVQPCPDLTASPRRLSGGVLAVPAVSGDVGRGGTLRAPLHRRRVSVAAIVDRDRLLAPVRAPGGAADSSAAAATMASCEEWTENTTGNARVRGRGSGTERGRSSPTFAKEQARTRCADRSASGRVNERAEPRAQK